VELESRAESNERHRRPGGSPASAHPRSGAVLVVGGGNAGLCAAIAARRAGAEVLLLERADRDWRGGNSKYTRNVRCVHNGDDPVMSGQYTEDELEADLDSVTGEGSDLELTRLVIEKSRDIPAWMEQNGIRWQPALRGTLQLTRTNRFFLGGGKALVNRYFRTAEQLGVQVAYESTVEDLRFADGCCVSAAVATPSGRHEVPVGSVVVASGGFEANLEWLREYWGDAVDNYAIRGSRHNDGLMLRRLLDHGAASRGNPRGFHAIAVDARSPTYEGGIVTRIDSVPFSIVVNREGKRFHDEGEDLWPKRYATWGRLIAEQPAQQAFSIFDTRVGGSFIAAVFPPYWAPTIEGLADQLGIPARMLEQTVSEFNASIPSTGGYDAMRLDGCGTQGVNPPKSNWALPIDHPPFGAYPLRPGITFTYLGVGVDRDGHVMREDGGRFENVFAAGEIMAGNILLRGYLAGFGMTIGTVSGRIAGEGAARHVIA
jgi:tricarballylate dehydrogenase